ncbi:MULTISPECIES: DUF4135 domain-containing protein [Corynebacterium]|uniref:DUF4135 domain-containing protein n=1 Tax=Corynebacterium TaxID=1716 RepID=UPI001659E4FF|nr:MULTISPECIES: DUF4135 domain-containing protein [Corynebacterium]QNP92183.1 DUF4135 domain-containing protein [Corynebacterium zhongnanshanii]
MTFLKKSISVASKRFISQLTDDHAGEFHGLFPHYLRPFLEQGAYSLEAYARDTGRELGENIICNALRLLARRHKDLAIRSLITHFQYLRETSTQNDSAFSTSSQDGIPWDYAVYNIDIEQGSARDDLFSHVPLLDSLTATCQQHWFEYIVRVLDSVHADYSELQKHFHVGGKLHAIEFGLGDPHRGGISVAICQWEIGDKVVLKFTEHTPAGLVRELLQSLDPHQEFFGPVLPFQWSPPERERQWQRYVEQEQFTADQAREYFRRYGRCSALILALGGNDFHRENVISTVAGPTFVDTETLTSLPSATSETSDNIYEKTAAYESYSVLRTLLFPVQFAGSPVAEELSAIGVPTRAARSIQSITICSRGTNDIRFDESAVTVKPTNNTVCDGAGNQFDPRAFLPSIVEGFAEAFLHLQQHRDVLPQTLRSCPPFGIRHVPRPTWIYAKLLGTSTHPSRLGHEDARQHTLELLPNVDPQRMGEDLSRTMRCEEIAALTQLDIPYFWIAAEGTVFGRDSARPLGSFPKTPAQCLQHWWDKVLNSDVRIHIRRIKLSLSAVGNDPYEKADIVYRHEDVSVPTPLPEHVTGIQNGQTSISWLTTHQISGKVQLNLISPSLYEGGGVLLSFLSDRRQLVDTTTKSHVVMDALRGAILHDMPEAPGDLHDMLYSAFGGIPGELATEMELAAIGMTGTEKGDLRYPEEMQVLLTQLPDLLERYENPGSQDYLNGLSGTFTAMNQFRDLLNLQSVGKQWAERTGEIHTHLENALCSMESMRDEALGLAHGRSGQVLGIVELLDLLMRAGVEIPENFLNRALALSTSLPDRLAEDKAMIDLSAAHSWCKGRAGMVMALSRVMSIASEWEKKTAIAGLKISGGWIDDWAEHNARFLLPTAQQFCRSGDISFCHGAAGGVLNWHIIGAATGSQASTELAETYYTEFQKVAATNGWRTGLYSSPHAEGFFVGRAGWDLATAAFEGHATFIPRMISLSVGRRCA